MEGLEITNKDIEVFIQLYSMQDSEFKNPMVVHQDKIEFMFSYLLHKHSDSCISKNNFRIVWHGKRKQNKITYDLLFANENLSNVILGKSSECKGKRFILIYLEILLDNADTKTRFSHANILILDRFKHTLERFEPYGFSQDMYDQIFLDKKLEEYSNNMGIQYLSPNNYCPRNIAFQTVDESDKSARRKNDPIGFCTFWSIFYADLRLTYPDIPQHKLVSNITLVHGANMRKLIRNYAIYVLSKKLI